VSERRDKPAEDMVREELRDAEESEPAEEAPEGGDREDDASEEGASEAEPEEPPEPAGEGGEADESEAAADDSSAAAGASREPPEVGDSSDASAQEEASASEDEDELATARRERDEYLALAQRTQADFENWRKRAAKEAAAAGQRAKSGLVGELLPVVDNLERALESASEAEEHLAGGVRLVHSALVGVLARNGVEPFDPSGERFDPAVHEALSTRAEESADAGVVLDVVEKGYRLNGTVLRPARVVVSG